MAGDDYDEPHADLATMLADMDTRLALLQQELESVALPIARRSPEPRRPARRDSPSLADAGDHDLDVDHDPLGGGDEPVGGTLLSSALAAPARRPRSIGGRAQVPSRPLAADDDEGEEPEQAQRPARPQRADRSQRAVRQQRAEWQGADPTSRADQLHATDPSPRARRLPGAASASHEDQPQDADLTQHEVAETVEPSEPPRRRGRLQRADAAPPAEPPALAQPRAKRRVTAVARGTSAAHAAAQQDAPRRGSEPLTPANAPEAVVRQTLVEAEDEARRVVEEARQRIAEIGARTRALLEHSLGEPPQPAKSKSPPPSRRRRPKTARAAKRMFDGAVAVEAGPFADVLQLSTFEDALASIPGVEDVYIRTFEHHHAHFDLNATEPTALIVELQARVEDALSVVAAGDDELRLEIVRDEER